MHEAWLSLDSQLLFQRYHLLCPLLHIAASRSFAMADFCDSARVLSAGHQCKSSLTLCKAFLVNDAGPILIVLHLIHMMILSKDSL